MDNSTVRHCEEAPEGPTKQSPGSGQAAQFTSLEIASPRHFLPAGRQGVAGLAMTLLILLFATAPTWAGNGSDYAVEVSTKLGRGVLNLVSSPLELPCTLGDEISERGGAGAVTGLFKGLAFFLRRALVGATEIGTFVIPMEATLPPVCAKKPEAQVES